MSQYVYIAKTVEEASRAIVCGVEEDSKYTSVAWISGPEEAGRYLKDEEYTKIEHLEEAETMLIFRQAEELIVIPPPGGAAFQFLKK